MCEADQVQREDFKSMVQTANTTFNSLLLIQALLIITGLYLIFLHKRRDAKPKFVKLFWALLTFILVLSLFKVSLYIWFRYEERQTESDIATETDATRMEAIQRWFRRSQSLKMLMNSIVHWVFASEYLKVSLQFPLLLLPLNSPDRQRISEKQKRIMLTLNVVYFVMLIIWVVLKVIDDDKYEWSVAICTIHAYSATLLVIAILRIRCLINTESRKQFYANERLIVLHLSIYILYVACALIALVSERVAHYSNYSDDCVSLTKDRAFKAYIVGDLGNLIATIALICLFMHISLKSIEPSSERWNAFLINSRHDLSTVRDNEEQFRQRYIYNQHAEDYVERFIEIFAKASLRNSEYSTMEETVNEFDACDMTRASLSVVSNNHLSANSHTLLTALVIEDAQKKSKMAFEEVKEQKELNSCLDAQQMLAQTQSRDRYSLNPMMMIHQEFNEEVNQAHISLPSKF